MRAWHYFALAGFLACMILLFDGVDAAGIDRPCSQTSGSGTAGVRVWQIYPDLPSDTLPTPGTSSCDDATWGIQYDGVVRGAGDSIKFTCTDGTDGGLVPPASPDNVFIYAYWDEVNYQGTPGTNDFFTTTISTTCETPPITSSFTFYCTSDGTASGSARSGRVRFQVQAVRAGVPAYDLDSDSDGTTNVPAVAGTLECQPKVSVFSDGNTASSPTVYVGGDTIRTTITLTGQDGRPATWGTVQIVCNAVSNADGSPTFTTATHTGDVLLEGPVTTWNDDCTLYQNLTITRNSALTGLTSTKYVQWNTTGAPAGVAFATVSNKRTAANHTAKVLDRTLTPTNTCTVSVDGTSTTDVPRGDDVDITNCSPWQNARGTNVANNQPARAWVLRNTTYRITTDFASFDGLFGASGNFPSNNIATTTAIDTSENPGFQYHKMVETFSTTARTDAVLRNWGNTSNLLDVNSHATWTSLRDAKSPAGTNESSFTIGSDQEYLTPLGLRDSATNLVSGATATCTLTNPNGQTQSPVSHGTTSAAGDGTEVLYTPVPPSGEWEATCTGTFNGNTGSYTITFFYVSSFTADKTVVIEWRLVGSTLQIGAGIHSLKDESTGLEENTFDDPDDVRYRVMSRSCIGCDFVVIEEGFLNQAVPSPVWVKNVSLPGDYQDRWLHVHAWGNFTGQPFLGAEIIYPTAVGSTMGNFTGNFTGNVTFLEANGLIETALDAYLPLLIWGSILFAFLFFNAWLPAMAALMAFGNEMLRQSTVGEVWPNTASFFLVVICMALHSLAVNGVVPRPWKKRAKDEEA